MKQIIFEIHSDGDFYCKPLFTTILHDDEKVLENYFIDNLREIHATFNTSRDYIWKINNIIFNFIKAYLNGETSYYDNEQDEVWFVKEDNKFYWSFNLDVGNQWIYVFKETVDLKIIDDVYLISKINE